MSGVTLPTIDVVGNATALAEWLTSHGTANGQVRHGAGLDADGTPFLARVGLTAVGVPNEDDLWCTTTMDQEDGAWPTLPDEVLAWPVFMVRGE